MTTTTMDHIEKVTILRAPQSKVWRALTDSEQFGAWFGMKLNGPLLAGRTVRGQLTIKGYEHATIDMAVERIEPETYFAYRWHPYAIDPKLDYSNEPMTLVEFRLEPAPEGTRLTVTESGFDRIPAQRRDEAYRMNDGGWKGQVENIRRYVEA
jgi:uncharacterized protein YndB with AHSA1/START domain